MKILRQPLLIGVTLLLLSWIAVRAGIFLGQRHLPPGQGYTQSLGIESDLYRFDAEYYRAIAVNGYSYNGDPFSSPNIVFAPLFPLAIAALSATPGVDEVTAGFALNKILFFLALIFLYLYLSEIVGHKKALAVLAAMVTSAGAYAFHAYYSESTMLFGLALCLYAYQRRQWPLLAVASVALGASRLTALPLVLIFSAALLLRAWHERRNSKTALRFLVLAAVCPLGSAAFLGYIHFNFANPFDLLPEIQKSSWGFFHPETSWAYIFTGHNLWDFWSAALSKGTMTFIDIKSLNLLWTTLAAAATIYCFVKFKLSVFSCLFGSYFLFIYTTGGGSDFLISAHRFYAMMIPIFMMFASLHEWITAKISRGFAIAVSGLLFTLNLFYCLFHAAFFNQGIWYYF